MCIRDRGQIIVEGPFAKNTSYCWMLAAATGSQITVSDSATGTSQGAALLALQNGQQPELIPTRRIPNNGMTEQMGEYALSWNRALNS